MLDHLPYQKYLPKFVVMHRDIIMMVPGYLGSAVVDLFVFSDSLSGPDLEFGQNTGIFRIFK